MPLEDKNLWFERSIKGAYIIQQFLEKQRLISREIDVNEVNRSENSERCGLENLGSDLNLIIA
jgi:hypothetical protein